MAKILISYFSEYGNHSYIGLKDELINNGNDVYLINWNNIIKPVKEWEQTKICSKYKYLINKIKNIKFDLVLNFCFSCPTEILDILLCPILIIDSDNPKSFWNKEYFKKNIMHKQYLFWFLESCSKKKFENYLKIKIPEEKQIYMPVATAMQKQNIPIENNISFLGSVWLRWIDFPSEDIYKYVKFIYKYYKKNFFIEPEIILNKYQEEQSIMNKNNNINIPVEFLFWHFAGQERLKYLSVLEDLGLKVYGNIWSRVVACFNMEIALNSIDGLISSEEDVKILYNSSKISVSFSHPQAPTGCSWRVPDIMASNSCLLVEDKVDWREYYAPYLSEETLNTVIYKDRFDMREKAIKLLNDEELRLRCVKDLNNAIEQNGRWKHRLEKLEKFLNIKLLNNDNPNPIEKILIINDLDNINNNKNSINKMKLNKHINSLKFKFKEMIRIPSEIISILYYLIKRK